MKKQPVTRRPETQRFLKTCTQILEFLDGEQLRLKQGLPKAASLELRPDGELQVQRRLLGGILLLAKTNGEKTATLQISLDPLRFEQWTRDLGPLQLYYADPFGIEVVFQNDRWGLFVDEQELVKPEPNEGIQPIAAFEIREVAKDYIVVHWASTEVNHEVTPTSHRPVQANSHSGQPSADASPTLGSRVLPNAGEKRSAFGCAGRSAPGFARSQADSLLSAIG